MFCRFCVECKAKVLKAYSLLVGEVDKTSEKGYCPTLYDGLKCCTGEKHIHVLCETDFIAHLIGRAEPELTGRYIAIGIFQDYHSVKQRCGNPELSK